jgi:hypothetical protein
VTVTQVGPTIFDTLFDEALRPTRRDFCLQPQEKKQNDREDVKIKGHAVHEDSPKKRRDIIGGTATFTKECYLY